MGDDGGGEGRGQKMGKMGGVERDEGGHNDDVITFTHHHHDCHHQLKNNNQLTVVGGAWLGVSLGGEGRRERWQMTEECNR